METLKDFAEKHSPYFGDIVFSKEPSITSKGIRKAQRVFRKEATSSAGDNYSHVAFVLDTTTIIHATKGGGVDLVSLKHFFETPEFQFAVFRNSDASCERKEIGKGTFYHGQKYDVDFFSRFVGSSPKLGKQVCSTLAANMLNNFELAKIAAADRISPNELLLALKRADWIDVTPRYSKWISSIKRRGDLIDNLVENNADNIDVIHQSLRNQRQVALMLSKVLEAQLKLVRLNKLGSELEQQIIEELNNIEGLEKVDYEFHDIDNSA